MSNLQINQIQQHMQEILLYLDQQIIGQKQLMRKLVLALLANGHLLVEGPPGLAKTKAIKVLASLIAADFHRIQFTPDLLPGDLTGTDVFRPENGTFVFQQGPIFHHMILADEINRAPAKVQSALLEAMAERQVSIGMRTYPLPELFMVMATQNPIEQEGTYDLPEAQLDRFLLHIKVDYPEAHNEHNILALARSEAANIHSNNKPDKMITQQQLLEARQQVLQIHMNAELEAYLVNIILATRKPLHHKNDLKKWIRYGASPRATIGLDRVARANAWLSGRDYVIPEDIISLVPDILRHRIILSYEAEASGMTVDDVIEAILATIPVP
jgi:MoxR-like ATPase